MEMDDLISRKALIAEYDRVHIGPPGGARKLMEDAPAVQQWIPVSERLPEERKAVLAFSTCYGFCDMIEAAMWTGYRWEVTWTKEEYYSVTHWMPLPEPPKE